MVDIFFVDCGDRCGKYPLLGDGNAGVGGTQVEAKNGHKSIIKDVPQEGVSC